MRGMTVVAVSVTLCFGTGGYAHAEGGNARLIAEAESAAPVEVTKNATIKTTDGATEFLFANVKGSDPHGNLLVQENLDPILVTEALKASRKINTPDQDPVWAINLIRNRIKSHARIGERSIPRKGIRFRKGESSSSVQRMINIRISLRGRGFTQFKMTRTRISQENTCKMANSNFWILIFSPGAKFPENYNSSNRAFPENGAAHSNNCGALGDGFLEIPAHAHAQFGKGKSGIITSGFTQPAQ